MHAFVDDLQHADVGDLRVTRRIHGVARGMSVAPDKTFPQLFPGSAALEGLYRFANRKATDPQDILAAHAWGTASRAREHARVLVLHDTTEFAFDDYGNDREHLSQLSRNRHGFYAHASLAVAGDGTGIPLGVVSMIPFVHRGQVDAAGEVFWSERGGLYDNESERWLDGCRAAHDQLQDVVGAEVVHVCDREGDAWALMSCLQGLRAGFVIRCRLPGRGAETLDGTSIAVSDALALAEGGASTREIQVPVEDADPKMRPRRDRGKGHHGPVPERRKAVVSVRWRDLVLPMPQAMATDSNKDPSPVYVSVVEVHEMNPPPGKKPARWLLYANLPVEDEAQAWDVVDIYRTRWVIEEYFKVIKTGTAYEKRQLTTAHGLLNILAVTAVVAGDVLLLRSLERHRPDMPATHILPVGLIHFLRQLHPAFFVSEVTTVQEALRAVAAEGGHLKHNGPPGWLVLYRGYADIRRAYDLLLRIQGSPLTNRNEPH